MPSAVAEVVRSQATRAALPCGDVLVLAARGSGEPPGLGTRVKGFIDEFTSILGPRRRAVRHALTSAEYPAHGVETLIKDAISPRNAYFDGLEAGVRSTLEMVKSEAARCPQAQFVLAGYSQGAMVMHRVMNRLQDSNSVLVARIAGAALLADGDRVRNTRTHTVGTPASNAGGIGIAAVLGTKKDIIGPLAQRTWNVCTDNGLVCDFALGPADLVGPLYGSVLAKLVRGKNVHTGGAYRAGSPAVHDAAVGIVQQVRATPKPFPVSIPAIKGASVSVLLRADVLRSHSLEWSVLPRLKMPAGLTLSSKGVIAGKPLQTPTGKTTVRVRSKAAGWTSSWMSAEIAWNGAPPQVKGGMSLIADSQSLPNGLSVFGGGDEAISADGGFVLLHEYYNENLYLYDRTTGGLSLATRNLQGLPLEGSWGWSLGSARQLSSDGRYVVFTSAVSDIVANDTNGTDDVFLFDRLTETTTLVSRAMGGGSGNQESTSGSIAADGTTVSFTSSAKNLDAPSGRTPGSYYYNIATGQLSQDSPPPGHHFDRDRAANGCVWTGVGTDEWLADISVGDTNGFTDTYLVNSCGSGPTQVTTVSRGADDVPGNSDTVASGNFGSVMSPNGRYVVYSTCATNIVAGDPAWCSSPWPVNGQPAGGSGPGFADVIRYDTTTGESVLVSHTPEGYAGNGTSLFGDVANDGTVVFVSWATDLTDSAAPPPGGGVYVWDPDE